MDYFVAFGNTSMQFLFLFANITVIFIISDIKKQRSTLSKIIISIQFRS